MEFKMNNQLSLKSEEIFSTVNYDKLYSLKEIKDLSVDNYVYGVESRENGLYLVYLNDIEIFNPADFIGFCVNQKISNVVPEQSILYMDYNLCENSVYYETQLKESNSDIYNYLYFLTVEYSYVLGYIALLLVCMIILNS